MPTYEDILGQSRRLGVLTRFFARRELRQLPGLLLESEALQHVIYGAHKGGLGGLLVATDRRLLFVDKRWLRLDFDDFPYRSVISIECQIGILTGTIALHTMNFDLVMRRVERVQARSFVRYVESRVIRAREIEKRAVEGTQTILPMANNQSESQLAEDISLLTDQRNRGLINEQEYLLQLHTLVNAYKVRRRPKPYASELASQDYIVPK